MKRFGSYIISGVFALSLTFSNVSTFNLNNTVYAYNEKIGYVTGGQVNVRAGAGVSNELVTVLNLGAEVRIIGEKYATNGVLWYQISFRQNDTTNTGYMSSYYIRVADDTQGGENTDTSGKDDGYESYLETQQFPESYRVKLRELHKIHPTWTFVALPTGLSWDDVVKNESKQGANLVPLKSITSWKSLESGAYDWTSQKWVGKDGANWVCASPSIVKYYLDPRSFLKDSNEILQFETLLYVEGEQTKQGLANILSGTFMATDEFYEIFMKAGAQTGVNPYHLASRCRQEVGVNGSNSSRAEKDAAYAQFNGYYNFFNIGASPSSEHDSMYNGLQRAKDEGWDTPEKSIIGGAKVVASKYINVGQNTLYLQKFDVVDGGNGYYWHQYMTNLQAAESESRTMSKAYSNLNEAVVTYYVPVYNNIPDYGFALPTYDGSVHCILSTICIEGNGFTEEFDPYKTQYTLKEKVTNTKFNIYAAAYSGSVNIDCKTDEQNNKIEVKCNGNDGSSYTYTINFEKEIKEEKKNGDVNLDGKIDMSDAYALMKYIVDEVELGEEQKQLSDYNTDGAIDVIDVLEILKNI